MKTLVPLLSALCLASCAAPMIATSFDAGELVVPTRVLATSVDAPPAFVPEVAPGRSELEVITELVQGIGGSAVNLFDDAVNTVGVSVGAGWNLDRNATTSGVTFEYQRALDSTWSLGGHLNFEQEVENRANGPDEVTNAMTVIASVAYALTPRLSLSTGLAKGVADDGNASDSFELADGDWTTGLAIASALPLSSDTFLVISATYEYNLSESESTAAFDLGFSFAF